MENELRILIKEGDRVIVHGRTGIVISVHEPTWIDHQTRAFRKVFQGADICFDGETHSGYFHAAHIEKEDK
jgi:hypothetical protein